jgi:hypothetical protein
MDMKKNIFLLLTILFLILLLIPNFTAGEAKKTIEIQGVIGDYAQEDRIFEVNGKIYNFDEDVVIQAPDGAVLTFADLKGGTEIKIIGEKTTDPKGKSKEKIKYIRIIVLK